MKQVFLSILLMLLPVVANAQEPVLEYDGELYFIPAPLTKEGKPFLYSRANGSITVYDENFNIIGSCKEIKEFPFKERVVRMTRKLDPDTKELLTEWTVTDDQTNDVVSTSYIDGFELLLEDNGYHTRDIYLSQTLFDDDEDFEFLRPNYVVIPVEMKRDDYYKEHSTGVGNTDSQYSSDEDFWLEYGADGYHWMWDPELDKNIIVLEKTEVYGGLYGTGLEVVSLDGTVKDTLPGINYAGYAYYYRGNIYMQGSGKNGSGRGLYLLNKNKKIGSFSRGANGDANGDGIVNAADVVKVTNIIMGE